MLAAVAAAAAGAKSSLGHCTCIMPGYFRVTYFDIYVQHVVHEICKGKAFKHVALKEKFDLFAVAIKFYLCHCDS
jgi:hypothetical protein